MIVRALRLPAAERRLAAEATLLLGLAALAIAVFPFRRVAALATSASEGGPEGDRQQAIRDVRRAVLMCSRRVPWRAKCLEQAFAAQWMLRRRSIGAVIHYGIASRPNGLAAHAWVCAGGAEIVGCESAGEFTEIARFPGTSG